MHFIPYLSVLFAPAVNRRAFVGLIATELPRQAVTLQTALEVETRNTGLASNAEVRKLRQRGSLGEQS